MSDSEEEVLFKLIRKLKRKDAESLQVESKDAQKKLRYPKSVFFIVANEFCERFSFYGLRTILTIYLTKKLLYDEDTSTVIYHVFTVFAYFFPLLGAIIADSWLGKFRTIFYLSVIYTIGNIVVSITAIDSLHIPQREITIIGLLLIALGTGGIKPCVSAFGGDQFIVPQQQAQLVKFFSLFYFTINAGSFISTFLTPVLREDVKCFGDDSCYSLAFGVPAILMAVSLAVFLFGKKFYIIKKPEGNVLLEVTKCIVHAIRQPNKGVKNQHWLDKAVGKYEKQFVEDVKAVLRVLVLFIPLPIFWALYDQQGSRWTFQATRMNGNLGNGVVLKPDQMQVLNPILILIFIPLFETIVYPLLARCNVLKKPLQRFVVGGLLAAVAFLISAAVEWKLEPTYPHLPEANHGQLRIYNSAPDCGNSFVLSSNITQGTQTVPLLEMYVNEKVPVKVDGSFTFTFECNGKNTRFDIEVFEKEATSYTIYGKPGDLKKVQSRKENLDKTDNADPSVMISFISDTGNKDANICFESDKGKDDLCEKMNQTSFITEFIKVPFREEHKIKIDADQLGTVNLKMGGAYVLIIHRSQSQSLTYKLHEVSPANTVHMLWLVPQYVVMTAGEVMFSITGLEFSFTQAPVSMKSVLTSVWLLTVAFGNLVVIIVAEAKFFSSQTYEFLLFAGLMFLDMFIFALMAMRYVPVNVPTESDIKKAAEDPTGPDVNRNSSFMVVAEETKM